MKIFLTSALLFFFAASSVNAQNSGTSKQYKAKTMQKSKTKTSSSVTKTENGVPVSSSGAEVSGVTGAAPGDPYNLAHPFFNGDPRWTHADTMYMHGDFPWAMVKDHPENFNFNATTGKWEVVNGASLGSSKQSR